MHSLLRLKEFVFPSATRGTQAPRLNCVAGRPPRSAHASRGCGGAASLPALALPRCHRASAVAWRWSGCAGEGAVSLLRGRAVLQEGADPRRGDRPRRCRVPFQRHQRNPPSLLASAAAPSASLPRGSFPKRLPGACQRRGRAGLRC